MITKIEKDINEQKESMYNISKGDTWTYRMNGMCKI